MEGRKNKDVWHFCADCSEWPKDGTKYEKTYLGFSSRPYSGRYSSEKFCKECLARREQNQCRTL